MNRVLGTYHVLSGLLASCLAMASNAFAQPEPWLHPDGTFHYYDAIAESSGITWYDAFDSARAKGGYLATLTSASEDSIAFGCADHEQFWRISPESGRLVGPWLGAYRPGAAPVGTDRGWQWASDEGFGYRNWSPEGLSRIGQEAAGVNYGEETGSRLFGWCGTSALDSVVRSYVLEMSADSTTVGLVKLTPDTSSGYTLFNPLTGTETYLIDNKGRLVHKWTSEYGTMGSAYLLENGNLLRNVDLSPPVFGMGGRYEILDWNSNVVWSYDYATSTVCCHHDGIMLPNGHVLLLAWEYKNRTQCIAAGRNPQRLVAGSMWPEHLIEIDTATKSIVWEWHLWDHLVQDFDSTKANYGVVRDHPELVDINYGTAGDWIHANSLDYHEEFDQIMISAHNFNEIWVIDHSTTTQEARGHTGGRYGRGGDLLYRWGNPMAYRAGDSSKQVFFTTHTARWIRNGLPGAGNIIVFNNGYRRPSGNYSTVDEFTPPCDSLGFYEWPAPGTPFGPEQLTWSYGGSPREDFYAWNVSGEQRMPNGNTLICAGSPGIFFEVTRDSQIVWMYINPVANGVALNQGDTVPRNPQFRANIAFRAERYAQDFPGFLGKDLTPGYPLELYQAPTTTPQPTLLYPDSGRTVTSTELVLRAGVIPKYSYDTFHFRLFSPGGRFPIREDISETDQCRILGLPPGRYEWECRAHVTNGSWLDYPAPRLEFRYMPVGQSWVRKADVPVGGKYKRVKDGGSLATYTEPGSDTAYAFALKGGNRNEFYKYNLVTNTWTELDSVPLIGRSGRKKGVKKGACLVALDGELYCTKGNNSSEFWHYLPGTGSADTWQQVEDVPGVKVKEGTGAVALTTQDSTLIYLLKGSKSNEFYRYNPARASDRWETLKPIPGRPIRNGSCVTSDGNTVFVLTGTYGEFYAYDVASDYWTRLQDMPLVGISGRKKKVKDGAALAWHKGQVYALKGGNTCEFWCYGPTEGWRQLEDMPIGGGKRVKAGGALAALGEIDVLLALKGNNTLEFWSYGIPSGELEPRPSSQSYNASCAQIPKLLLSATPNPFQSQLVVSYNTPDAATVSLKLYDVSGKLVRIVENGQSRAGSDAVAIDGRALARGVYLLKLEGSHQTASLKVVRR
ncbi:MAG: aryl-sulfate sulfotransferase [candidate division WOR-3 bacterium]